MSRLKNLWRAEPIAVIYVIATAIYAGYSQWQGGVGWNEIVVAVYGAAAAALARFNVYAPDTVDAIRGS